MFLVMVALTVTGWGFRNWQYWMIGVIIAALFILIDKRYPKTKREISGTVPPLLICTCGMIDNDQCYHRKEKK